MKHDSKQFTVTIAAGAAVSGAFSFEGYNAAIIEMPAAWTTADLGLKVGGSDGATFVPLKDRANGYGEDVSIDAAAAAVAYPLPGWVLAAPWVKLWSHNGSGVDVNQAALRTFKVFLKG